MSEPSSTARGCLLSGQKSSRPWQSLCVIVQNSNYAFPFTLSKRVNYVLSALFNEFRKSVTCLERRSSLKY